MSAIDSEVSCPRCEPPLDFDLSLLVRLRRRFQKFRKSREFTTSESMAKNIAAVYKQKRENSDETPTIELLTGIEPKKCNE